MKFQPNKGKIVIEMCEAEDRTPGGILLADTAQKPSQRGRVIAVGEVAEESIPFLVGQLVLCPKYSGSPFTSDGKEYTVYNQEDVHLRFDAEIEDFIPAEPVVGL